MLVAHDETAYFYYLREIIINFDLICRAILDMMPKGNIEFSTDTY